MVPYMVVMIKTTVYLSTDLALTLRQLSAVKRRSQAEVIRDALAEYARHQKRPPIPGVGEFDSGESDVSERAEEILREAAKHGKWRRTSSRGAHR
jgi:hypothetical protein